jgi:hypothetical protein
MDVRRDAQRERNTTATSDRAVKEVKGLNKQSYIGQDSCCSSSSVALLGLNTNLYLTFGN